MLVVDRRCGICKKRKETKENSQGTSNRKLKNRIVSERNIK